MYLANIEPLLCNMVCFSRYGARLAERCDSRAFDSSPCVRPCTSIQPVDILVLCKANACDVLAQSYSKCMYSPCLHDASFGERRRPGL
jgi:hypothetical protein